MESESESKNGEWERADGDLEPIDESASARAAPYSIPRVGMTINRTLLC